MFPLVHGESARIARLTGLEHSVVWSVTEGRREPRITTAARIAGGLEISLDQFNKEWLKVRQKYKVKKGIQDRKK